MKKICFFNSSNFWGGGEKLHLENAKAFRDTGYHVTIAAHPKSELWSRAISEGFQTFAVSINSTSFLNVFKLFRIKSYFKKQQIDTIIFTTSQDAKTASIAGAIACVPKIVYLRGLATPIKNSFINRYCLGSCITHIVANSEETKRTILQNLGDTLSPNRVPVIYHGVDASLLENNAHCPPEIHNLGRGIILGNAGRLTKQKGQKHLITVAKNLKAQGLEFTLFIAGTGELHSELQHQINTENLQNEVILLGFVADMDAFMQHIDVFLLGSSWEGFGFVLVEAMAKGKPIVAFDITSNPEIISDRKTGLLARHQDLDDFTAKTKEIMTNTSLRQQLGRAAKRSVINRFLIADRIIELEQHLLKEE